MAAERRNLARVAIERAGSLAKNFAHKVHEPTPGETEPVGLRSWFKQNTAPKPRRPWVRPEFLGIALIAGALLGVAFVATMPEDAPQEGLQQRSEYVGLDPASLPLVDCAPSCRADALLVEWQAAHPNANVLESTPRYQDGRLIGYDVIYQE